MKIKAGVIADLAIPICLFAALGGRDVISVFFNKNGYLGPVAAISRGRFQEWREWCR